MQMVRETAENRGMKKLFCLCLTLIALVMYPYFVAAEPSETLTGAWVLDVTASERSVLRARPFQNVESFAVMPPLGMMVVKFDGDTLAIGLLPDLGNSVRFRRATESGEKMTYVSNHASKEETIVVSALTENNISVTLPTFPESQHFLWKRVKLDPSKKTPSEYRPEFEAYISMLTRLWKAFNFSKDSLVDTNSGAR